MSNPTDAIKIVWQNIEAFLDLTSTISISATCHALRGEIVDADTQKIKVSHFSNAGLRRGIAGLRHETHLASAMNAIYFPTLKRIDLGGVKLTLDGRATFSLLVSQLGYAHRLESLQLNVASLCSSAKHRRSPMIKELMAIFCRNLTKCKRLIHIAIYVYFPGHLYYCRMKDLLLALTPALSKQRNAMQKFEFSVSSRPENTEGHHLDDKMALRSVAVDFFCRILRISGLRSLEINIAQCSTLTCALLEAAKSPGEQHMQHVSKKMKIIGDSSRLQRLTLELDLYGYRMDDHEFFQAAEESESISIGAKMLLARYIKAGVSHGNMVEHGG
ncbi:hypothetical protein ACHAWF_001342 [Thalassiosira exigua]